MFLRYITPDGEQHEHALREVTITIGRGTDADLTITDKMISRIHCGITFWEDAFFIRDFTSRNGTFVNDKPIDVVRLNPGDRIRIGDTLLSFEATPRKGTDTVMREVSNEMAQGKGYHTILHEILKEKDG